MRVLFAYDCLYPGSIGGVEHRNRELAIALGKRGHDVTLAGWSTGPLAPEDLRERVRTEQMPFAVPISDPSGKRRPIAAARFALAAASLRVKDYDVIETASIPYLHVFPLARKCASARVPLLVSWYEFWGDYFGSQFGPARGLGFAAIERAVAHLGTACCAVSQLTASRLARVRGSEVPVLPAGIHFERLGEIRRSTPKGRSSLVYAGRLIEEKRVSLLLEALPHLLREVPDATLTVVGEGPDRPRLEAQARALGVSGVVRFTGRLPDSGDVFRLVAAASVAVQLSRREGFGMFPLEAMALGTPIVYCESSESALSELVGQTAGIVVPADPVAVARAVSRLLLDPVLLDEKRARALGRARGFDWDAVAERFETLAESCIRSRS